ncbi:MAG: hypothetical protein J1F35_00070 [Erysipelotrichales bacterium]|nr:hypothetical protein [Erysipelotrichales bacterium]
MKKRNIILVILLMLIGFAALATNLYINGTVNIGFNEEDYVIIFTKAKVDGVDKTKEQGVIEDDGRTLNFETKELTLVGDKSILEFDVTNNSKNYDAKVEFSCELENPQYSEYYSYSESLPEIVRAGKTISGYVEVKLEKSSAESFEEKIVCTIKATALEKTGTEEYEEPIEIEYSIVSETGTINDIGTEIQIDGENFYVIGESTDTNTVYLLSKLNLKVESGRNTKEVQLAPEQADVSTYSDFGALFSKSAYWTTLSLCTSGYPCNLNGKSSEDATAINAAIAYGNRFKVIGRLMTIEDLDKLVTIPGSVEKPSSAKITNKSTDTDSKLFNIVKGTESGTGFLNYYLGDASDTTNVWLIRGADALSDLYNFNSGAIGAAGVRPVLEISKTSLVLAD